MRNLTRRPMVLLNGRRGTVAGLQAQLQEAGSLRAITDGGGDAAADEIDRASAFSDRDAGAMLAAILTDNRLQIDHAMERLESGNYGVCEDCGTEIPAERLKVFPEATRCVACQRRQEMLPPAA